MVGASQGIVGVGVIVKGTSGGSGAGVAGDFINETFVYDGADNVFVLADPALKVLNVYIDNATFPNQVPVGAVTEVEIDAGLILIGNEVTIQYIK